MSERELAVENFSTSPPEHPLTAVVAMTPEGIIGRDGDMPWRLKTDLRRFKSLTMGGWLVMGRKTFDSIGRPLPGRQTLVLTRNPTWSAPGVVTTSDHGDVPRLTQSAATFVVGGGEIYRLLWPRISQIFLTTVLAELEGDTRLNVDWSEFQLLSKMAVAAGDGDDYPTEFSVWQRSRKNCEKSLAVTT